LFFENLLHSHDFYRGFHNSFLFAEIWMEAAIFVTEFEIEMEEGH